MMQEGRIVKSIADCYTVQIENGQTVACKARGIFRKNGLTPLTGDRVLCLLQDDGTGVIDKVLPRRNFLDRPAAANIDRLYVIVSAADPAPVPLLIDRMTALAWDREIQPILVLNKTDLADVADLLSVYQTVPQMPIFSVCAKTGEGIEVLRKSLSQPGISVLCGNSGVGKSSLLNQVDPAFAIATGETSKKLGRGRHTTRHVELYAIGEGFVADTPGFSSLNMEDGQRIYKENVIFAFPELHENCGGCRFADCTHTGEKGCVLALAAKEGRISQSRLESYRTIYKEAAAVKEWERR